ncbi:MAG TPA: LysM domain-containing protein [Anaerolineae bacterium]
MNRHHLLLLLLALLAGLIIALLAHSSVTSAPLRITTTPSPTPTPRSAAITYVVQRGDTLSAIARRFGVSVIDIARANNIINPNLIRVGQTLIIPIQPGGTPLPTTTPTPTPAPGSTITYVVQRGDTLYRIAVQFGTTVAAIRAANNLTNVNLIYIGQTLIIPLGSTPPRTPTPTLPPFPTPTIKDVPAAFQSFERGFMIWVGDRKRIWVAVCCTSTIPLGGRWLAFDDAFTEGLPESDPSIVPPAGLYQPVRGFGLVWRTLSDYSYGGSIRDLLGWATAPERGYTAHMEYHPGGFFDPGGHFNGRPGYWTVNAPDGTLYNFHEAGPAWSQAAP